MLSKVKRIQVPNKFIRNKLFNEKSLYLYVILKMVCINNHVNIKCFSLLEKLGWSLNTFKKYLKVLKQENIVITNLSSLPIHKPIEFDISPITQRLKKEEDYFTQVDVETIEKIIAHGKETVFKKYNKNVRRYEKTIRDEKEKALKLFFLYESYYNELIGVSFPSYDIIKDATGYNGTYIKAINDMFKENNLVDVMTGERNPINNKREKNNYIPRCNRIKNSKNV